MGNEYRAKVFKSGNSLALRLPKALGLKEGTEMTVREEHGRYIAAPIDMPRPKIKGDWIGTLPWLEPLEAEDRLFDHSPRPWDDPEWQDWSTVGR